MLDVLWFQVEVKKVSRSARFQNWLYPFKNGVFTLKMHRTFSFHTTLEEFINVTTTCVWKNRGQGNHIISIKSSFSKSSVLKLFSLHMPWTQSPAFWYYSVFKSVFIKLGFRDGSVYMVSLIEGLNGGSTCQLSVTILDHCRLSVNPS